MHQQNIISVICARSIWQDSCGNMLKPWPSNKMPAWLPVAGTDRPGCGGPGCHPMEQRTEKALAALTFLKCPKTKSMPIKISTAHVSSGRVLKTETQSARMYWDQINQTKETHKCWPLFFENVFFWMLKTDSWSNFKPPQPPRKEPKWVISVCRLTTYSKTRVRVSLVWMMSWRRTMLACFRPFRRDAAETKPNRKRQRVDTRELCYAFISCIIRISHHIQGIRKRLKHKEKTRGGFTTQSSHTHLSTCSWRKIYC